MEDNQFDVVIFGTGLVESILAAALSKAGYKVAHIDSNSYYGGDEASLSLEELVEWADQPLNVTSRYQRRAHSSEVPSQSRQYSICLQPTVLPAVGPLISSLVMSGVAKYSGFRLLDCVSVYDSSGRARGVPGSKEDIFKSKDISLIEKRRLMRFLTFAAAGEFDGKKELDGRHETPFLEFLQSVFSLSQETCSVIAYSLAFCMSATEPTLLCLQRLQKFLRSSGRYGPSPFIIGHYGGIGDIAQGFCRAAAVSGGVYILSRNVVSVTPTPSSSAVVEPDNGTRRFNYDVVLEDFPDTLSCNLIISAPSCVPLSLHAEIRHLPPSNTKFPSQIQCIARCIAIIDQALSIRSPPVTTDNRSSESEPSTEEDGTKSPPPSIVDTTPVDTGIIVFPPSSVPNGSTTHSATVLINGEGSLSTPKGKWIIYIGVPLASIPEASVTPESLVKPYLDALMTLSFPDSQSPIKPLFTTFFIEIADSVPPTPDIKSDQISRFTYLVPPSIPIASIPDIPDEATAIAENTYREAIKALHAINNEQVVNDEDIAFWPPLPVEEEEEDNEW